MRTGEQKRARGNEGHRAREGMTGRERNEEKEGEKEWEEEMKEEKYSRGPKGLHRLTMHSSNRAFYSSSCIHLKYPYFKMLITRLQLGHWYTHTCIMHNCCTLLLTPTISHLVYTHNQGVFDNTDVRYVMKTLLHKLCIMLMIR